MLKTFVRLWKTENDRKEIREAPVDLIIPICYTTMKDRLTLATELNFNIAVSYLKLVFPEATLAFGNWPRAFPDSEKVESALKFNLLPDTTWPWNKVLETTIDNSVDEAMNLREATMRVGLNPKRILIVTGELHSRSVRFIYERVFPEAKILITCIHYTNEVEKDHCVRVQRSIWKWTFANLARHLLLRTMGMSAIRGLRHRSMPE